MNTPQEEHIRRSQCDFSESMNSSIAEQIVPGAVERRKFPDIDR